MTETGCLNWKNCASISHKHCVKSWRNLARLWRAQKLCDIVITCQGKAFHCHEIVPASASPFFRNALLKRSAMSVNTSPVCTKEIIIDFMDQQTFAQVLNFMYTSEIEISPATIRPLILAGGRLQIQGLVGGVCRSILDWELKSLGKEEKKDPVIQRFLDQDKKADNLARKKKADKEGRAKLCDEDECCGVKDYEDDLDEGEAPHPWHGTMKPEEARLSVCGLMDELRLQGDLNVHGFVQNFAARHYNEIVQTPAFQRASVHTVGCLLGDERLKMNEFDIFMTMCKWLQASSLHLVHAPYLLSKIRLGLLTPNELSTHVETKEYLMKKKKCRVLILEAFRYHCLRAQAIVRKTQPPEGPKRRFGSCAQYDSDDEDFEVQETTGQAKSGGVKKKDPREKVCPIEPCACCPDYILCSGGIDTKQKVASEGVFKYEERENNWLRFARLPQTKNHHAAVYCKGALYILGGSDPTMTGPGAEVCPVSSCHRLGLGSLKWAKIESMTTPRMSFQAVYFDGFIYAIGGQDHKQRILRDVERFSVARSVWEHSSSLASARAGMAVCVHNRKIWIMGGYCHKSGQVLENVDSYSADLGRWDAMAPLRFPRCFAAAATCKEKLYILGGAWLDNDMDCSNFSSVYDVDRFDHYTQQWEGITALRIGRHDSGIAVLGPRIYIIGGKHCDEGSIGNLGTVECYDVAREDWVEGIEGLPIPLLGPGITYTSG